MLHNCVGTIIICSELVSRPRLRGPEISAPMKYKCRIRLRTTGQCKRDLTEKIAAYLLGQETEALRDCFFSAEQL
jgi:hypothetical protein